MRFLSIYKTVETGHPPTPEHMQRMTALIEEGFKGGWLMATEGCLPTNRGMRVRRANGEIKVTDGPFTESKEVVGGFAILKADSRDEALALTRRFLSIAGDGECELRELYEAPVRQPA
jgi:hypothetical protein